MGMEVRLRHGDVSCDGKLLSDGKTQEVKLAEKEVQKIASHKGVL
jgi:hypothetical protein